MLERRVVPALPEREHGEAVCCGIGEGSESARSGQFDSRDGMAGGASLVPAQRREHCLTGPRVLGLFRVAGALCHRGHVVIDRSRGIQPSSPHLRERPVRQRRGQQQ